jgi:hypothetical protein
MMFGLERHFWIKSGNDSIPCTFYHVQPTGKIDNAYRMLLEFESLPSAVNKPFENDLILGFSDPITGANMLFPFKKDDLNNIPELKK